MMMLIVGCVVIILPKNKHMPQRRFVQHVAEFIIEVVIIKIVVKEVVEMTEME